MKKLRAAVIILLPIIVGGISSLITGDMSTDGLNTPPLSPPEWVFPIAWSILYILIGIASYIVLDKEEYKLTDRMKYFYYNLALNFTWPILFFKFDMYTASAVLLAVMLILATAATKGFWDKSKVAGKLMLPYVLWLCFALYLNIGIAVANVG